MSHVDNIISDIIGQMQLHINMKKPAYIGVFTARHNLNSVTDGLRLKLNAIYNLNLEDYKAVQRFLEASKIRIDIWQKPSAVPNENHLTLTVGGFTAIIFDYEN